MMFVVVTPTMLPVFLPMFMAMMTVMVMMPMVPAIVLETPSTAMTTATDEFTKSI
jgi:hypothetical protein